MNKVNIFGGIAFFVGLLACGGSEPEPQTPTALAPTASAPPPAAAPATVAPQQPAAAPVASSNPALAPVEPALQQMAASVLMQAAAEEAPGAKGLDLPRVAILGPGQAMEQTVTLKAGKCYTAIAIGLPPVAELNVQFLPAVAGLNVPLAQDSTTGPRAVLGKGKECFQPPLGVTGPIRVLTTAVAGNGLVGVQVFEK